MKQPIALKLTIIALSGLLLVAAFSPFNLPWLAPIVLTPLLLYWRKATPWQAFFLGLFFGFGFFGFDTYWIYISVHRFGGANPLIAFIITAFVAIYCSLFIALLGYGLTRIFKKDSNIKWLIAFPSSWVIFEWIRGLLFTGFPWNFLGYSQTGSSLKGFAPIIGVYGVSFIIALCAGLLLLICIRLWKMGLICLGSIAIIWLAGFGLGFIHWTKPTGKTLSVSLIQGNIPQSVKWQPATVQLSLNRYQQLTEHNWESDLIIWPEAAIPLPLTEAKPYINKMDRLAKEHNSTIILGIPTIANENSFYNSAIAIGNSQGQYDKQHLVPFGEYVPLEKLLRGLIQFFNLPMSSLISNPKTTQWIIVNHVPIAPFICYEIAYPNLVRKALPKAQLLLTLTDDAWFGKSFASAQHLQIGQMRSLETGRYSMVTANTGITAIITPQGCLSNVIAPFQADVLNGKIIPMTGTTPWVFFGPWSLMILLLALIIMSFMLTQDTNEKK